MIDLESRHGTLDVVDDQRGQPTWSADVAARLVDLGPHPGRGATGALHATGGGEASWYEPVREALAGLGADPDRVRPVGSGAFPQPAPRPAYGARARGRRQELGPADAARPAIRPERSIPLIRKESPS